MKIKESELKEILDEVAADLSKAFSFEKERLSKAVGDKPELEEVSEAPKEESVAPVPPAPAPEASMSPEASVAEPAPEESPVSPEATPEGSDPAEEDSAVLTPEALQAKYAELAPDELDMHLKAALAAKAAMSGGLDAVNPPEAPAGPGLPPPGPDASASPVNPTMKAELAPSPERKNDSAVVVAKAEEFLKLHSKSEEEIESLKELAKSQAEDIANLTAVLTKVLEQPLRKSITSVSHLPKTTEEKAPLTKATIHARLKELAAKPDLKKSDRNLINDFFDGRIKADKLAPLFEDYK